MEKNRLDENACSRYFHISDMCETLRDFIIQNNIRIWKYKHNIIPTCTISTLVYYSRNAVSRTTTSVRDERKLPRKRCAAARRAHTHAYWFILSLLLRMARSYVANHHHVFYKKKMTSRFGFTYNIILQCLVRELLLSSDATRGALFCFRSTLHLYLQPRTFLTSFYIIPHSRSLSLSLTCV